MTREINNNGIMEEVLNLDELLDKYDDDFNKITEDDWMFLSREDMERLEQIQMDGFVSC